MIEEQHINNDPYVRCPECGRAKDDAQDCEYVFHKAPDWMIEQWIHPKLDVFDGIGHVMGGKVAAIFGQDEQLRKVLGAWEALQEIAECHYHGPGDGDDCEVCRIVLGVIDG